jgi:transposase-like protein
MMQYTKETKEHVLTLMSAPQNKPVVEVSKLTGISEATLYLWRKQARSAGRSVPGDGQNPEDWGAADKFAMLLETAPMAEAELAENCR